MNFLQNKKDSTENNAMKFLGDSTDVDRFAHSKMLLETENIWKNKIDQGEISYD